MTTLGPGVYVVEAPCPHCRIKAELVVELVPVLTTVDGESTMRVKLVQKAVVHLCGQARLDEPEDGQRELDWAERAAGDA